MKAKENKLELTPKAHLEYFFGKEIYDEEEFDYKVGLEEAMMDFAKAYAQSQPPQVEAARVPSDEEILEESHKYATLLERMAFQECAKWMLSHLQTESEEEKPKIMGSNNYQSWL